MTKSEFFRDARNDLSGPLAGVRASTRAATVLFDSRHVKRYVLPQSGGGVTLASPASARPSAQEGSKI